jgi:hypothetical protein
MKINDILANDSPNIYFITNTNSKEIDIEWEDDSTLKIIPVIPWGIVGMLCVLIAIVTRGGPDC